MKKLFVITFIAMMLLINCIPFFAFGFNAKTSNNNSSINISYFFDTPNFQEINSEGNIYSEVNIDNAPCFGKPGEPVLPVKGAFILLPQKTEIEKITVTPGNKITYDIDNFVKPGSKHVRLSDLNPTSPPVPDMDIYNSYEPYPGELKSGYEVHSFRGYNILILNLYPVQYTPAKGEITYYKSFDVNIKTQGKESINPLFRGLLKDREAVKNLVDNPSEVNSYTNEPSDTSTDLYDLLIITKDEFKNEYQRLVDNRKDGIRTIIKTIEEIDSPVGITPFVLKNYIRLSYWNYGIEYVLLGGDSDVLPTKYVEGFDPTEMEYMDIATDQWYVNLDSDMTPELYIGRTCADNISQVANFVDKTLDYVNINYNNYNNALFVGEHLWNNVYGKKLMNELIDHCTKHGYTTYGIPSINYNIDKLYDKDKTWKKSDIKNKINDGAPSIINHVGHGNNFHVMKLDETSSTHDVIDGITNEQSFFLYSQACYSGAYDNIDSRGNEKSYDSIAESFTVKTSHGAYAGILNSRYGWGSSDPDRWDGPSQHFHRKFWNSIFSKPNGINSMQSIGEANLVSKVSALNYKNADLVYEFCYWEITLFGDPTVEIKGAKSPTIPDKPYAEYYPEYIHHSYCFYANAEDPDDDSISYGWDWDGDSIVDEWTDYTKSGIRIKNSYIWRNVGTYNIKVKVRDQWGFESEWSDPLTVKIEADPNNPAPPDNPFVDGEPNGKITIDYYFNVTTDETDGDQVYYLCDFGDNKQSDWIGPQNAKSYSEINHTWTRVGNYTISVKAKDIHGAESEWSYLDVKIGPINMIRSRNIQSNSLKRFIEKLPIFYRFFQIFKFL